METPPKLDIENTQQQVNSTRFGALLMRYRERSDVVFDVSHDLPVVWFCSVILPYQSSQ